MDYTSRANVKAYHDVQASTSDTLIDSLITAASRMLDQHCRQQLGLHTATNVPLRGLVDPVGVLLAYPDTPTIATLTALSWRRAGLQDWTALDTSDVEIEERDSGAILRVLSPSFLVYRGARLQLRATYTGGWADLDAVPANVEWTMRRLCTWMLKQAQAPIGKTVMADLGQIMIPPGAWPRDIVDALRGYVKELPS